MRFTMKTSFQCALAGCLLAWAGALPAAIAEVAAYTNQAVVSQTAASGATINTIGVPLDSRVQAGDFLLAMVVSKCGFVGTTVTGSLVTAPDATWSDASPTADTNNPYFNTGIGFSPAWTHFFWKIAGPSDIAQGSVNFNVLLSCDAPSWCGPTAAPRGSTPSRRSLIRSSPPPCSARRP